MLFNLSVSSGECAPRPSKTNLLNLGHAGQQMKQIDIRTDGQGGGDSEERNPQRQEDGNYENEGGKKIANT